MLIDAAKAFLAVIDVQERLLPVIADNEAVERNCSILIQAAGQMNVPTVVSEQYPKGLGKTVPGLADLVKGDAIIPKMEFSCARDPALMKLMEQFGRKQAILCGVEAHICVLQTALELQQRGFEVFVAVDATGSRSQSSKEVARDRMNAAGISLVTTEMVVFEMVRTSAAPQFKALSKLIQ
ncbi:hydrolase [Chelativorans sp.]|uniref:hydrolase n=1 Tax=Chelativorans sp. TaxID=2203393 RepID=UPI0028118333|nr:hydrolase [Chelativorans sp.]